MSPEIIEELLKQGPYFALLVVLGYAFYKFLDRSYLDHKEQMKTLQEVFERSLANIINGFGTRLDKIENTLEDLKK